MKLIIFIKKELFEQAYKYDWISLMKIKSVNGNSKEKVDEKFYDDQFMISSL